jgi:hypothetical protein
LRGYQHEMAEERFVGIDGLGHGANVAAGHDEHVDRGLRLNVGEGVTEVVGVDGGRGNTSIDDFAEEATHNGTSVQERGRSEWRVDEGRSQA